MSIVKISELAYVEKSGFTPNDLYVLVNYQSPSGTVHTTITDIKDYVLSGVSDTYVTGFSYNSNTFTISDNSGNTYSATINDVTGLTVNGDLSITGNTNLDGLTANTISATTYLNLPGDIFITGGTFDKNTETLTLERSSGSSVTITGFTNYYTTGFTYSSNTFTILDSSGNTFPVTINDVTGLTINGDLIVTGNTTLNGLTATTVSATTYLNLPSTTDIYVTGFTYSSNTFTILDSSGNTYPVTINEVTGLTINGDLNVTGNTFFDGVTANTISATTYLNLPGDIFITGGTFDNTTDTLTLERSSGSSITITGFTDYFTTGATIINNVIYFDRNDVLSAYSVNLSAFTLPTDVYVTGATYNDANTFTFTNNTGGTFDVSFNVLTGLTANTISAATYQNLPTDIRVTGGTYSAGTATFTNNTGGTFNVTGFTTTDTFATGFTYSANTFTISRNQGLSELTANISIMTGLTINGDLTVTGNTNVNGLTATTISASTYQNLPKYTITTGFTSNETKTITHGLNTSYIHCTVWNNTTNQLITAQVVRTMGDIDNSVDITIATVGTYDILITG